jgi:cyclophilin family peptidyl-prolyl cis-trans isomerase
MSRTTASSRYFRSSTCRNNDPLNRGARGRAHPSPDGRRNNRDRGLGGSGTPHLRVFPGSDRPGGLRRGDVLSLVDAGRGGWPTPDSGRTPRRSSQQDRLEGGRRRQPRIPRNHRNDVDDRLAASKGGTVSLARDLVDTGFALPEIFICLGDFPQLDFGGRAQPDELGFPAFGEVVIGRDIAEKIAESETAGTARIGMLEGQILTRAVAITAAQRSEWPS